MTFNILYIILVIIIPMIITLAIGGPEDGEEGVTLKDKARGDERR